MSPEQKAVFEGHSKRLAYRRDSAAGTELVYECRSLGFIEVQRFPKRRTLADSSPRLTRFWQFIGSEVIHRSLAEVANVLLRQGVRQKEKV
jgi:hypothetical protein